MAKKCFLCDLRELLIDFNDETFETCSSKLSFRKKKNFKYKDVELTKASLDFVGYHAECYKKVTVSANKYSEEYEKFRTENTNHVNTSAADERAEHLDSRAHSSKTTISDGGESKLDTISLTSADLNEEPSSSTASPSNKSTCLFCNFTRKNCGKKKQNLIFPQDGHGARRIKRVAQKFDDAEILSKLANQTVAYHQSCYAKYQTKERRSMQEDSIQQKYRNTHKLAFETIKNSLKKK